MEDNDDLWIVFLIICAYSMCHVYYVTIDSLFTWFISLSSIVLLVTLFISLNQMICYGVHKNVFLCHEPIITVITTELWTLHRTKMQFEREVTVHLLYDLQIYRKTQYTSLKNNKKSQYTLMFDYSKIFVLCSSIQQYLMSWVIGTETWIIVIRDLHLKHMSSLHLFPQTHQWQYTRIA